MCCATDGGDVSPSIDSSAIRRYLLGSAGEDERAALEQRFFEDRDALDQMEAGEDDLIESYLARRLDHGDRQRFETHYLASGPRRVRVETIRRLQAATNDVASVRTPARRAVRPLAYWLGAAAVVTIAIGGWWVPRSRPGVPLAISSSERQKHSGPTDEKRAVRVFAFSLSPASVRGLDERTSLVIPPGTEVVAIDLDAEGAGQRPIQARATIRTVDGRDVWEESASVANNLPAAVAARLEVPADRLPPDDYIVTLVSLEGSRVVAEVGRYYLRVRK
jgi:hypothetical protein